MPLDPMSRPRRPHRSAASLALVAAVATIGSGGAHAVADATGDPDRDFEFKVGPTAASVLPSSLAIRATAFDVDGQSYVPTAYAGTVALGIRDRSVPYKASLKAFHADTLIVKYVGGEATTADSESKVTLSKSERSRLIAAARRCHTTRVTIQTVAVGRPAGDWSTKRSLVTDTLPAK